MAAIFIWVHPGQGTSQQKKQETIYMTREMQAEESLKRIRMAAERGDIAAQVRLGLMYSQGKAYGVGKNFREAEQWFRKAAEQRNASAQFHLGLMYFRGDGVRRNYAEAVDWFHKAAEQGEASAQVQLGSMYVRGDGVTKNYAEAEKWFHTAAEQGDASAQYMLGLIYSEGKGIAQDYVQAHMWLNLFATTAELKLQKKGAKLRDAIARQMSPRQIQEAERLAREWKSAHLDLKILEEDVNPGGPALVFSTFFGGCRSGLGLDIAVDKQGFLYITGRTEARRDFPRVNPAQKRYGGGGNDAFVAKLTPDGQKIVYSTFLGGRDVDWGNKIAVDDLGNAYVAGTTYSGNFPTTRNAFQRNYGGGDRDGFVAKLSADGALIYSTLLGGDRTDRCNGIDIDREGNVYVTGSTNSQDFALSQAAADTGSRKDWDVFAAKLDATGTRLLFVKRFGGSAGAEPDRGGWGGESGSGIKIGNGNMIYVAGSTDSSDFPIRNGFQTRFGGRTDGFIARLRATDGELLASTYLGGRGDDGISAVALDAMGNVHVTGTTQAVYFSSGGASRRRASSGDFPVRNAIQPQWAAYLSSAFVTKLNADLTEIEYSTYLSGSNIERGYDIAVDNLGNTYVVGSSQSKDFPLLDPLQPSGTDIFNTGDVFITKINAGGTALLFSTRLGGSNSDDGLGVTTNDSGDIFVTGSTMYSQGYAFPTVRALQSDRRSYQFQAFICRIRP